MQFIIKTVTKRHWIDCILLRTQMPESRCSPECPYGHRKLQIGQHKCCFKCIECPASTFLNKTGKYTKHTLHILKVYVKETTSSSV